MELCDRCSATIPEGQPRYICSIEIRLDDGDAICAEISDDEIERIVENLSKISSADLQDRVHRKRSLTLCPPCARSFMRAPFKQ